MGAKDQRLKRQIREEAKVLQEAGLIEIDHEGTAKEAYRITDYGNRVRENSADYELIVAAARRRLERKRG